MKKIFLLSAILFIVSSASVEAQLLEDFNFALIDKFGFATISNDQKIEGAFKDNFSNSVGVSIFIDSSYGDEAESAFRGELSFSLSCFYDYQKLLGESSHSMRYGLESNVFFLSGGIFQTYDFTNNKIDFLGSLGVKFGKWFNDYLGFEINAGIEHAFLEEDNFIRLNVGLLAVPFPKPTIKKEKIQKQNEEKKKYNNAINSNSTENLEKLCISYAEKKEKYPDLEELAKTLALLKLGEEGETVSMVYSASDIENPYTLETGKLWYFPSFRLIGYTENGVILMTDTARTSKAYFFVKDSTNLKEAKSIRRGFLRAAGKEKKLIEGTELLIPVFDYVYCF